MIINFKLFEQYVSEKEGVLNQILDKIQQHGKEKLSADELNFLEDYPDGSMDFLKKKEKSKESQQDFLKKIEDSGFEFYLMDMKYDDISNTMNIHGDLLLPTGIKLNGYFETNLDSQQIHQHFSDDAYDYIEDVYELEKFLEIVFFSIIEDLDLESESE